MQMVESSVDVILKETVKGVQIYANINIRSGSYIHEYSGEHISIVESKIRKKMQ